MSEELTVSKATVRTALYCGLILSGMLFGMAAGILRKKAQRPEKIGT
jgi:hypothetical protein